MSQGTVPEELSGVLVSTPDTLSGSIRFDGTRVPVQALLDSLEAGDSLEEFLDNFPGVTRDQIRAVIVWEQQLARAHFGLDLRP